MNWISVEDRLPDDHGIVIARRKNGNEIKCYFHKDKMAWTYFYFKKELSHFQDYKTLKFHYDVTHWRPQNESIT